MTRKKVLLGLLVQNKFEPLFEQLSAELEKGGSRKRWWKELINLQAKYNSLNKDSIAGLISHSELNVELARVRKALITIIESLDEAGSVETLVNKSNARFPNGLNTSFVYLWSWLILGLVVLGYGFTPTGDLLLERLSISCSDAWVTLKLKAPWQQDNISLKEFWLRQGMVDTNYYETVAASGNITLEGFFVKEGTSLELGTELNSMSLRSPSIRGKILGRPETKINFISPMTEEPPFKKEKRNEVVGNSAIRYDFTSAPEYMNVDKASIRLTYKERTTVLRNMMIDSIDFSTTDENDLETTLIKEGELVVGGIKKDRFRPLATSDLVRIVSTEGANMRLTLAGENMIFDLMNKPVIKLFIGEKLIKSLRLKIWFSANPSFLLIGFVTWGIGVAFLFSRARR